MVEKLASSEIAESHWPWKAALELHNIECLCDDEEDVECQCEDCLDDIQTIESVIIRYSKSAIAATERDTRERCAQEIKEASRRWRDPGSDIMTASGWQTS